MKIDTSDYYPVTPGSSCGDGPERSSCGDSSQAGLFQEAASASVQEAGHVSAESTPHAGVGSDKDPEGATWQRVADRIANVLSWVLVPLLMPLYATILVFNLSILQFNTVSTKWTFCLLVFCITAVVPMLLVLMLKKLGIVQDLGLNGRKERLYPYLITILSLAGAGWFMLSKGAPLWCGMFYFGGALTGVVNMLINFRWKISAHAAAIAGVVALLVCLSREGIPHPHIDVWISCTIALAGLLGSARVWLGRHTVLQVLAGSAVGFLCVFFLTLI